MQSVDTTALFNTPAVIGLDAFVGKLLGEPKGKA